MESTILLIQTRGMDIGTKVLGALILWFIGGWVIRLIRATVGKALEKVDLDVTLERFPINLHHTHS